MFLWLRHEEAHHLSWRRHQVHWSCDVGGKDLDWSQDAHVTGTDTRWHTHSIHSAGCSCWRLLLILSYSVSSSSIMMEHMSQFWTLRLSWWPGTQRTRGRTWRRFFFFFTQSEEVMLQCLSFSPESISLKHLNQAANKKKASGSLYVSFTEHSVKSCFLQPVHQTPANPENTSHPLFRLCAGWQIVLGLIFKMWLIAFKAEIGLTPSYISDLLIPATSGGS